MTADSSPLTDQERALYGARADVLIPAGEGQAIRVRGQGTRALDRRSTGRPAGSRAAIQAGADHRGSRRETLHRESGELFDAYSVLTAGAYLMNPEVKTLIGYPGQEERPVRGDDLPQYIGMLERVVERGPVYRPTVTG